MSHRFRYPIVIVHGDDVIANGTPHLTVEESKRPKRMEIMYGELLIDLDTKAAINLWRSIGSTDIIREYKRKEEERRRY